MLIDDPSHPQLRTAVIVPVPLGGSYIRLLPWIGRPDCHRKSPAHSRSHGRRATDRLAVQVTGPFKRQTTRSNQTDQSMNRAQIHRLDSKSQTENTISPLGSKASEGARAPNQSSNRRVIIASSTCTQDHTVTPPIETELRPPVPPSPR
ncbi:hypothetical protein EYC84_006300 [Monilinia fructicola]|uniref:Uncharacterized protein n=1 Tax=Monilinia fructicola TaxID=38448 RepID=A0A5M9K6E1_MONFR|nr:hypothetical protein EYC84_006300 [Monilinia fructicola]